VGGRITRTKPHQSRPGARKTNLEKAADLGGVKPGQGRREKQGSHGRDKDGEKQWEEGF